ncbi:phenylalanine--tRNA ligase subunit beta [Labedella endophytica]|uniref:Phenylalanine--tRNA ligase beta subunit n=1 Tax=Labedella endophytica TaxID=1523160 RepID=A0A3S0VHF8_9MICO|nr:phenylalanine--tRNA ligase subunit beta [Labedella endophytica]RUR02008.1 phenylalanine--tRNA ligase subunit beta [Labedella endophytica]
MRVPLSWLAEYVELSQGTTPEDVHAALVRVGLEEEEIHRTDLSGPIVVGEVLEFVEEPQKNGKTIRWCQVRVAPEGETAADGGESVHGIVCGASNFFVGDKVAVTLPGAVLPGPFPIAARKTYGHVSDGMIASSKELGLGDEHDGILRLTELGLADAPVGADVIALLGLDDSAVEINVTPDRGYAFSIRGVAREYAHATGAAFTDPAEAFDRPAAREGGYPVAIQDQAPIRGRVGASVFVARTVRGVDVSRATPQWMSSRLRLAGIRSISLPVDITNYVMLEMGQPIHGYDLATLRGQIVVRRAEPGERLTTLDGQDRALHSEDLLITDDSGPIGLAGVMGGATTEIGDGTRDILIEAARFDTVSIARTARRHKLPSEASKRFERGVDPNVASNAADRVAQLLVELAGGSVDEETTVIDDAETSGAITLPEGYVSGLVGFEADREETIAALREVGCVVDDSAADLAVTPPSWRPDITERADLAEEVARILGYDRIPALLPVAPPGRGLTAAQILRRRVADALAAWGATEVLAYPFVSAEQNALFGAPDGDTPEAVRVANPLDATVPFLRTSLLPGLLAIAGRNQSRGLTDLTIFESGTVFRPARGRSYGQRELPAGSARPTPEQLAKLQDGIPPQPRHVSVVALGNRLPKRVGESAVPAGLADVLAAVQVVALATGVRIDVTQGSHHAFHPGRTAALSVSGAPIGFAGELLPAVARSVDLPRTVAALELDLDAVIAAAPATVAASPIQVMPAATQDLSLVVANRVPAAAVLAAVREGAGELLEDVRLVDDYRGQGLEEGTKSLTFALRFRSGDHTLTAAEASAAKLAGSALAGSRFGATIRE